MPKQVCFSLLSSQLQGLSTSGSALPVQFACAPTRLHVRHCLSTKARWTVKSTSSAEREASFLIKSAHRHVRGPLTSRSCSWSSYRGFPSVYILAVPLHRSSIRGATNTSLLDLGKSCIMASLSSSERDLLNCLSRKAPMGSGAIHLSFYWTDGSNSTNSKASCSSSR